MKNDMNYMKKAATVFCLSVVVTAAAQGQSYTLDDCIEYAISHNINVQKRALDISQQEIALNTSKNAWLPSINLDMSQMFGFNNPGAASGNSSVSLADDGSATIGTIGASMPLFDGFKIKNQAVAETELIDCRPIDIPHNLPPFIWQHAPHTKM